MTAVAQKIISRIRRRGRGWVFTPRDFADLAPRSNVDTILHRLAAKGQIRHYARGIYDYPQSHPGLGLLSPAQDQILDAIARATGDRILPTGADAANKLGLTTQVPSSPRFVTTGNPRTIRLTDKYVIKLQKSTLPKTLTHYGAYLALMALADIGPDYVDQKMIDKCAQILKPADKKDIQDNLRYIRNPWLADIARQLTV